MGKLRPWLREGPLAILRTEQKQINISVLKYWNRELTVTVQNSLQVMVRGTLIIGALEIVPSGVMSQAHTQPGGGSPMELLLHRKIATIMLDRER